MKRKAWGDWDPICTFNEPNNFPPTTPPPQPSIGFYDYSLIL